MSKLYLNPSLAAIRAELRGILLHLLLLAIYAVSRKHRDTTKRILAARADPDPDPGGIDAASKQEAIALHDVMQPTIAGRGD